MSKSPAKRARRRRQQARCAKLPGWLGHPSHLSGRRYVKFEDRYDFGPVRGDEMQWFDSVEGVRQ